MPRISQPVPADWARYATHEGNLKLRRRFCVGGLTIERWRRETGLYYATRPMPKPARPVVLRKAKKARMQAERIEDLNDGFDLGRCVRSGGAGVW